MRLLRQGITGREFWKEYRKYIDGLYCYCKECARAKSRETYAKRRQQAKEVVTSAVRTINVELQRFTPRELIAELRSRGYVGELKYTQVIKV